MTTVRIALFGDLVGAPGQAMFQKYSDRIRQQYNVQAVIVNGENSADGKGITPKIMKFFKHNGADVVTTGNHIWQKKEIYDYLAHYNDLLRPANFPSECPGTGVGVYVFQGVKIGVLNLQGRIFMREHVNCPFKTADTALLYLASQTKVIIVDFHAEATAEKLAIAHYLSGRVSAVVGTHTHVQTADARILPGGTAYITDLGMGGALNSMIGMKKEPIIHHMITQLPVKFEVDPVPPLVLSGVVVTIDVSTGAAQHIEPLYIVDENISVDVNI
jgi:2',3'-cyclic-nucleotide 2'-phosphodiesterase